MLEQRMDERLSRIHKDLQDISKKVETITDGFERKIMLLRKDLDIPSISKLIKAKAEEEEVKKGFFNVDGKINVINEQISGFKKTLVTFKKQLMMNYGSKKGVIVNCLSCGRPEGSTMGSGNFGIQSPGVI